jgi:hypothetical protein
MTPIKNLILEGPDLAGKSTLYKKLHSLTGFKYNTHDRSTFSALCYAVLYDRNVEQRREAMRDELCDANNFVVVMMPPLDTLLTRLRTRGDEFQDETSLRKLYGIFQEELSKIENLPNVCVVRPLAGKEDVSRYVAGVLQNYSEQMPGVVGKQLKRWTILSRNKEVQFRASFEIPVYHYDPSIMDDPHESQYYASIKSKCEDVIRDEVAGRNPYGVPQDMSSRRFYYNSDTCISSIHFMPRGDSLTVICSLRSTDSVKNGEIDVRFLSHLAAEVPRTFGWNFKRIRLDLTFNSLHVRDDVV